MRPHQQDILELGGRAAAWIRDENHLTYWTLHDAFYMATGVKMRRWT